MKFWIFMMSCNLLIPVLMAVFGRIFVKRPPKKINGIYGYRTKMSMKNMDTWNFAHLYCGRLWWKIGLVMLPVSVIAMFPLLGKDMDTVGLWGGIMEMIQGLVLVLAIIPVERALKKNFDTDGNWLQD